MNLKVGDIIRFKDMATLHKLESEEKLIIAWNIPEMDYLCGKTIAIKQSDIDMTEKIEKRLKWPNVLMVGRWYISPDMFELVN
jgi:hydroxymethylpyrimidine/phosphomethylpyrimidine kinase